MGTNASIAMDDLTPGKVYAFTLRDFNAVIGEFRCFVSRRGRPLVLMVRRAAGGRMAFSAADCLRIVSQT